MNLMNPSGFLLIDKPTGWTSHDVVAKIRNLTGVKKVGHGGTLDPMATGLLVLGLGAATKELDQFVMGDKAYLAEITLGQTSTTDDAEGELAAQAVTSRPTQQAVRRVLEKFTGNITQTTPTYSALKTGGKKHYELARAGKAVPQKTREVTVHSLALLAYQWPQLTVRAKVSKGTYIRSLARDIGETLGTSGYLSDLRRENVGTFSVENAHSLDENFDWWREWLLPLPVREK